MKNKGGLYIHIPYCAHKCLYCDFYSGGVRIANWGIFLRSILNELSSRLSEINFFPLTLYIGGGTPSLIPPYVFRNFIKELNNIIGVSNWQEFTIEVNPEDVSTENIHVWKECGVNRISLGIQSLKNEELNSIGRFGDEKTSLRALEAITSNFHNVSVDVMYGLPNQTPASYNDTLHKIIQYSPKHISAYSLMLEEGTAMSLLVNQNKISLPDESTWLKMVDLTNKILESSGYQRYEISNYALSGFASQHNSLYWKGNPYLGLGPGAHSYDSDSIRRYNPADIKGYLSHFSNNFEKSHKSFFKEEILTEEELQEEMIMTRLRMTMGINLNEFSQKFGENEKENLLLSSRKYIDSRLMKKASEFLSLTNNGFLLYNTIVADLI